MNVDGMVKVWMGWWCGCGWGGGNVDGIVVWMRWWHRWWYECEWGGRVVCLMGCVRSSNRKFHLRRKSNEVATLLLSWR